MFGLTTTRRLRAAEQELELEASAHWSTQQDLATANEALVDAYSTVITERAQAERDHSHYCDRLTRALRACARYRTQLPPAPKRHDEPDKLWSLIDWSLWGSGMGDTFREQLADQFIAAITPEQHKQALELIRWWTEDRGRTPLGRLRYEDQQRRLHRALRGVARWRTQASAEHRAVHLLAEQLLDATSGTSPSARDALGLDPASPWQRAVDALNALVDAVGVPHIWAQGIEAGVGTERIDWNRDTGRWELRGVTPAPVEALGPAEVPGA